MSLLSVIIPIYNNEKYINECAKSVLNQPCKDVEIIIVDDGSTDNSAKKCDDLIKCYDNVRLYKKSNGGVSSARNYGLEKANGKYVMFLDSDDAMFKNFYDIDVVELLSKDYDVYGFQPCCANNSLTRYSKMNIKEFEIFQQGSMMPSWSSHSSFIIKKSLLLEDNIKYPMIRFNEDEIFRFLFLLFAKSIKVVEKPIFLYRNNPLSATHKNIDSSIKMKPIIESWVNIKNSEDLQKFNVGNNLSDFCDVVINFQFLNWIEYLAREGFNEEEIIDEVSQLSEYSYFSKSFLSSNSGEDKKQEILLWFNHPKNFILKYSNLERKYRIKKVFSKVNLLQRLYEKRKYNVCYENILEG